MIIDHLCNAAFYFGADVRLQEALQFLQHTTVTALPLGRHDIRGKELFVLATEGITTPEATTPWEAHRAYIDLQYVVEGGEWMGYAPLHSMRMAAPYDERGDCALYEGRGNFLRVTAGMFVIFNVTDVHKPSVHLGEPERVKKLVMKIRATLP